MPPTGEIVPARARGLRQVSGFLLAVQILSFGHLLLVRHVTCPEHGDFIHVQRSSFGPATADAGSVLQRSILATEPCVDAEHDHCLACVETNRRALLSGPPQVLEHHAFAVSALRGSRAAFFAPIDLIRLSPKSSPPLA